MTTKSPLTSNDITARLEQTRREGSDSLRRRGVDLRWLAQIQQDQPLADPAMEIRWWWRLVEGAAILGPGSLLPLFHSQPFQELERQVAFIDYLADLRSPLCTKSELRGLLRAFTRHLEVERMFRQVQRDPQPQLGGVEAGDLRAFGLPTGTFDFSPWLDDLLRATYPVRAPWGIERWRRLQPSTTAEEQGQISYTYQWTRPVPGNESEREGPALVEGLDAVVAAELDRLRETVSAAKVAAIHALLDRPSTVDPLDATMKVLTSAFKPSEMKLLLETDRRLATITAAPQMGGITDLLTLAGHVACEERLELFHQMRISLEGIAKPRWPGSTRFDGMSYFHLYARSEATSERIETVLRAGADRFYQHEDEFWRDFEQRVNTALKAVVGGRPSFRARRRGFRHWLREHVPTEPVRAAASRSIRQQPWGHRVDEQTFVPLDPHGVIVDGALDVRGYVRSVLCGRGITAAEAAKKLGVAESTFTERFDGRGGGPQDPRLRWLEKVAAAAGLKLQIAFVSDGDVPQGDENPNFPPAA